MSARPYAVSLPDPEKAPVLPSQSAAGRAWGIGAEGAGQEFAVGPRFRALEAGPILSSLAGQGTHLVLSADGRGGQVCPWPVCQTGTSPKYMGQGHCSGRRPAPAGFPPTSEHPGAMLQLEEDTPSFFWMSPARVTVPLTSWVL